MARVMIVDDAMIARRVLRSMLIDAGHEVIAEAETGESAVEAYRAHRPDVVLMDISMPGIDGIEALQQIVSQDPSARVVMATSVSREKTVREALNNGAAGYVVKPYRMERIVSVIESVLAAQTSVE